MLTAALTFVLLTALALAATVYYQHRRAARVALGAATVLFESADPAAEARPVTTRLAGGDLLVEAPVVFGRLAAGILVLEIKSQAQGEAEGFELALTAFDPAWLRAKRYGYTAAPEGMHLLVGPQGVVSDRLLQRTAREHGLDLPRSAGDYVQAYPVQGVTTDPADHCLHAHASLPSGAVLNLSYDYAAATLRVRVPAGELTTTDNYQALGVRMEAM